MLRLFTCVVMLICLPLLAAARDFLPEPEIESGAASYSHRYANCTHGFSLDIPKGQTGYDESGPFGMSGVTILLARGGQRAVLSANAVSNAEIGIKSLDEAASAISKLQCKQRGGSILSEPQSDMRLDGEPARRIVMECLSDGRKVIDDTVTVFHSQRQIVYMIGLRADRDLYAKHLPHLEALLKSWRLGEPGCG